MLSGTQFVAHTIHKLQLSGLYWCKSCIIKTWLHATLVLIIQGMLSGALCWDVLEEQLLHARTSSNRIKTKIFDFAVEHHALLKQKKFTSTKSTGKNEETSTSLNYSAWVAPVSVLTTASPSDQDACLQPPCYHSWLSTKRSRESTAIHNETVSTLEAVLDLSTHLQNYPVPCDTSLAKFVVAEQDLYIPRQHIATMPATWPGKSLPLSLSATIRTHPARQCFP